MTSPVAAAIRSRRTHKAFGPDPLDRATIDELIELARWAPNHHLTNPWRFRVVGPHALERLKAAAGPDQASKLDRAPTLIAVSARVDPDDPIVTDEDRLATACAVYIVLLGAHDRGLVAYWRTPGVLRSADGAAALQIADDERPVGLIYLGRQRQEVQIPERAPLEEIRVFLD